MQMKSAKFKAIAYCVRKNTALIVVWRRSYKY